MQRGISQSGLSIFRDCPYAFKLHYVDLKEAMFHNYDFMDIGSYVHKAIERYYDNYYLSNGSVDDILKKSYGCLTEIWDTFLLPEYLKKAYDCLVNHAKWEHDNIAKGIGTKPLIEVKLNAAGFFGYVDYIDLSHNKAIDWKTGKYPNLGFNYRMQAHVYKAMIEEKFGIKLPYFYFFFLGADDWRIVSFVKEKQIEVGEEVQKLLEGVRESYANEEFEKRPRTAKTCRNCNYRLYCKFGGGINE